MRCPGLGGFHPLKLIALRLMIAPAIFSISMLILGLNMFHADASAAIIQDGEVVFAIAEERLNRIKHFAGFPALAMQACLNAVGAKISDIDHVAVGQDSDANLTKKVQYALANPAKILNFIKLRQRKEAMRDIRLLLGKAFDVAPRVHAVP